MPSDDRRLAALQFLRRERDAFRAAVTAATEQVRTLVLSATSDPQRSRAAGQLGAFAQGRIDAQRFGEVFTPTATLAQDTVVPLRYIQCLLTATITLDDEAFLVSLQPGENLLEAVVRELSMLGRVFAAAHMVATLRSGVLEAQAPEPLLGPLAPDRWTRGERTLAPPVVVELNGADLRVGGLEELLQGAQKIVLLVNGAAPPAALVRLVTPHVFVMQCRELGELAEFAAHEGPGIAAVVPDGMSFVFKPGKPGGLELRGPAPEDPRRRLGRTTAFQQSEELQWLLRLARALGTAEPAVQASPSEVADPADRLAAWLLKQGRL